jgi:hypothetical protein
MVKYVAPDLVDLDDSAFGYGSWCEKGSQADQACRAGNGFA